MNWNLLHPLVKLPGAGNRFLTRPQVER